MYQGSQISEEPHIREFIKYCRQIVEGEKNIDAYRIHLLLKDDFDFVEAFKKMDQQEIGEVDILQLKQSLEMYMDVIISERELNLLFCRYDKD